MKPLIGVISDDLTGAADSGIQLVEKGINTSVLFNFPVVENHLEDAVVIDTNSRHLSIDDAFKVTKEAGFFLKKLQCQTIYKKIDSTLRGHIGIELKALEEVFQPTFIVIVPALPIYNRVTIDGIHYLNGKEISESGIVNVDNNPIKNSYIPDLLKSNNKKIGLLKTKELGNNLEKWGKALENYKVKGVNFIVCDAETDKDLICLSKSIYHFEKNIIWAGSAGLIKILPQTLNIERKTNQFDYPKILQSIIVCGSLSKITKEQVEFLLKNSNVYPIEINTSHVFSNNWFNYKSNYIESSLKGIKEKKDLLLFLSYDKDIIQKVENIKVNLNLTSHEMGVKISESVSSIVSAVFKESNQINNLILTGGDIAKNVVTSLNAFGFKLISQPQPGMPFGILLGPNKKIYAVTKAGAFGKPDSIYKIIKHLKG